LTPFIVEPVRSLSDLRSEVSKLENDGLPRPIFFRGEEAAFDKRATPSLTRGAGRPDSRVAGHKIGTDELRIVRDHANESAQSSSPMPDDSPLWIAHAQHYGKRTRLVDVTERCDVALFFACWRFKGSWNAATDGWIYLYVRSATRVGIGSTLLEAFDDPYPQTLHLFRTADMNGFVPTFNARERAQAGLYLWWDPPETRPGQLIDLRVEGAAKEDILRELGGVLNHQIRLLCRLAESGWEFLFPDPVCEEVLVVINTTRAPTRTERW
jgi:hypothetical protein